MKLGYKRNVTVNDNDLVGGSLTLKQSLIPNALVTILFFLWGFAYGLLDVLNSHFQTELHVSASQASGLSAAYFGAYFIAPLTFAGYTLQKYGFRVTFMMGLSILAVGCLMFWPSGVYESFGGFCGSMFIVGCGLGTLETGADNFLSICGPPRYSEIRLNLAQSFQGIGSFVAPLLASRVFFANTVNNKQGLKNVQWVYLGVAGFVLILIVFFYFAPIVEVTDMDMHTQEAILSGESETADDSLASKPFKQQYNLFIGIWSQFCYIGAQVSVANYFINFCQQAGYTPAESSNLLAVAQGTFAACRFMTALALMHKKVKPRYILMCFLLTCFVFCLAATLSKGKASVAMLILVLCFESACFATIFTLALRGLGKYTKRGGSCLVASIVGGAIFPPITGAVATKSGNDFHKAMAVPTAAFISACAFPIYLNFWGHAHVDARRQTDLNVTDHAAEKEAQIELESKANFDHIE